MGDLLDDTAVRGESSEYTATIGEDWAVFAPQGGYLAAIALRAAGAASQFDRPANFSCHYLGPAMFGPARLSVRRMFGGRRAEALRVAMSQEDRPILEATVWAVGETTGDLEDQEESPMPASPPIESLSNWDPLSAPVPPLPGITLWNNIEQRLIGWQGWHVAGEPRVDGWYRYRSRPILKNAFADAARSIIVIDVATWMAAMNPHIRRAPIIAPTMALNVRFYHAASTEWLRCVGRSEITLGRLIDGSAAVWSSDGRRVAQADCQLLYRTSAKPPEEARP